MNKAESKKYAQVKLTKNVISKENQICTTYVADKDNI